MRKVAKKVFEIWQKVTNLEFVYASRKSEVLISITTEIIKYYQHRGCQGVDKSSFKFDG